MTEYIEREALLKEIDEIHKRHGLPEDEEMEFSETDIRGLLLCLHAADVAPVVHGRWIFKRGNYEADECNCSECGQLMVTAVGKRANFCPNCGARMDGGDGDAKE